MVVYLDNLKLIAYKSRKPMLSNNGGKDWVKVKVFIDKKKIDCHFDKHLGNNIYFEYDNSWYRICMSGIYYDEEQKRVAEYSFNPLNKEVEFITVKFCYTSYAKS